MDECQIKSIQFIYILLGRGGLKSCMLMSFDIDLNTHIDGIVFIIHHI